MDVEYLGSNAGNETPMQSLGTLMVESLNGMETIRKEYVSVSMSGDRTKPTDSGTKSGSKYRSVDPKKQAWAKGTGFGGCDSRGGREETDLYVSKAKEIQSVFDDRVAECLNTMNTTLQGCSIELFGGEVSAELVTVLHTELRQVGLDVTKTHPALYWLMSTYLRNDSLVDIGIRKGVYQELLVFVTALARGLVFINLLTYPLVSPDEKDSSSSSSSANATTCLSLLKTLHAQANIYLKLNQRTLNQGQPQMDDAYVMNLEDLTDENIGAGADMSEEVFEALAMCLHIVQTYEDVCASVEVAKAMGLQLKPVDTRANAGSPGSTPSAKTTPSSSAVKPAATSAATGSSPPASTSTSASPSVPVADVAAITAAYQEQLGELRFEAVEMVEAVTNAATEGIANCSHIFLKAGYSYDSHYHGRRSGAGTAQHVPKNRMSRIAKEMSGLLTNLPIELGSSIFVRCDEARQDILKALIIGPEGTPYANGCFEFDIMLPADYPETPPMVKMTTTGGGRVRFNPNLYADGKVCLSLLGTWSGPSWDPKVSTLLQVLVSIQSLVMVPDPYFNEPSYETSMHTADGKRASEDYNNNIKQYTAQYAIAEQIKNPPHFFRDIIFTHFRLKLPFVRTQLLREWALTQATIATTFAQLKRTCSCAAAADAASVGTCSCVGVPVCELVTLAKDEANYHSILAEKRARDAKTATAAQASALKQQAATKPKFTNPFGFLKPKTTTPVAAPAPALAPTNQPAFTFNAMHANTGTNVIPESEPVPETEQDHDMEVDNPVEDYVPEPEPEEEEDDYDDYNEDELDMPPPPPAPAPATGGYQYGGQYGGGFKPYKYGAPAPAPAAGNSLLSTFHAEYNNTTGDYDNNDIARAIELSMQAHVQHKQTHGEMTYDQMDEEELLQALELSRLEHESLYGPAAVASAPSSSSTSAPVTATGDSSIPGAGIVAAMADATGAFMGVVQSLTSTTPKPPPAQPVAAPGPAPPAPLPVLAPAPAAPAPAATFNMADFAIGGMSFDDELAAVLALSASEAGVQAPAPAQAAAANT